MKCFSFLRYFGLLATLLLSQGTMAEQGFEAFQETLYPFVRTHCKLCHEEEVIPSFAAEDPRTAYEYAKTRIDFKNYLQSKFISQATNGHCGKRCRRDGVEITALLKKWSEAEVGPIESPVDGIPEIPDQAPSFYSKSVSVTSSQEEFRLEWSLGESRADLKGVKVEVIGRSVGQDGYFFHSPRIRAAERPLRVRGMRIHVNGEATEYAPNSFFDIDAVLPSSRSWVLLTLNQNLEVRSDLQSDEIKISFVEIEPIESPDCRMLEKFQETTLPLLRRKKCAYCHDIKGSLSERFSKAEARLSWSSDVEELCRRLLSYSNVGNPIHSTLIKLMKDPRKRHPKILFRDNELEGLTDWIEVESR